MFFLGMPCMFTKVTCPIVCRGKGLALYIESSGTVSPKKITTSSWTFQVLSTSPCIDLSVKPALRTVPYGPLKTN
jgi:hypothetical protein